MRVVVPASTTQLPADLIGSKLRRTATADFLNRQLAAQLEIRAEDGRSIASVDISNFVTGLPRGEDTSHFSTANASGSTSQAAAISEALEVGASCLLIDAEVFAIGPHRAGS